MSVYNIISGDQFYAGRTARFPFELREPDGSPLNLTAVQLRFAIAEPATPATPLISKTESDILIQDAPAGRCVVVVPDTEMDLDPGTYRWEIAAIWSSDQRYTYGSGTFRLLPSIDLS